MLSLAVMMLVICLISSTPEGREEAGQIIEPIARALRIPTLALWGLIAWMLIEGMMKGGP